MKLGNEGTEPAELKMRTVLQILKREFAGKAIRSLQNQTDLDPDLPPRSRASKDYSLAQVHCRRDNSPN
jgi:hypothetical protein